MDPPEKSKSSRVEKTTALQWSVHRVTATVHKPKKDMPLLGVRHPFSQNSSRAFDPLKASLNPKPNKLGKRT